MGNRSGFIGEARLQAYCNYGRERLAVGKTAARVSFPDQASLKYLPAGIYYHLISVMANHLAGATLASLSPLTVMSVAMIKDEQSRMLGPAGGAYVARSITMQPVRNREASERVFTRVRSNSWVNKHEFSRTEFDQWFDLSFRPEERDRFPGKDELLKFMIGEFKIEEHPGKEGIYRIVNQISVLKSTSEDLVNGLEIAATLHEVCRSAEQCLGRNWASTSLFIADPATGLVRLAARRKGNESESHYSAWTEPAYLLAEARRRYVEEDDKAFVVNLNEDQPFVDNASRESDAKNFIGDKAELLVGVLVYKSREDQQRYKSAPQEERREIRARSIYGYWHVSNRVFNDEEGQARYEENFNIANRPPISPNTDKDDLVAKLHTMVLHQVAEKLAARKEARGGSISAIWNSEEKPEETSDKIILRKTKSGQIEIEREDRDSFHEYFGESWQVSDQELFDKVRKHAQVLNFGGSEILFVQIPSEKLYDVRGAMVRVYRELIVSMYRENPDYSGMSDKDIVAALSLDQPEEVARKVYLARYATFVLKNGELQGFISGNVQDDIPGVGTAFEIPVAMIRPSAERKGVVTFVTLKMLLKEFWRKWYEMPIGRRVFRMAYEGIPLFAWTQSKRVVGNMLDLDNLWLPMDGEKTPKKVELIVRHFSEQHSRPLDESLVARGVYKGRIAFKEKETFNLYPRTYFAKLTSWLTKKWYANVNKALDELGELDTLPIVGFFRLGVAIKVSLYMWWINRNNKLEELNNGEIHAELTK
ncbi:MAG: hypothetical protein WCW67_08275 [Candidatus Margulisiibacteriota bacterium]|jgi:hypothetical protein